MWLCPGCACGCVMITAPVAAPLSCAAQPAPVAAPCGCACAGGCALELRGSGPLRPWLRPWPRHVAARAPVAASCGCACVCARGCQAAHLELRPALGCACGGLRLCPRLWLMHAAVRVLTRYNHQLHADVPPLRARLCLGRPRPDSAGGPGPGLQLHVGRGLCLRGLQRHFVLRIRVLFPMQQRRLGRHLCKYHIHKYHKAS